MFFWRLADTVSFGVSPGLAAITPTPAGHRMGRGAASHKVAETETVDASSQLQRNISNFHNFTQADLPRAQLAIAEAAPGHSYGQVSTIEHQQQIHDNVSYLDGSAKVKFSQVQLEIAEGRSGHGYEQDIIVGPPLRLLERTGNFSSFTQQYFTQTRSEPATAYPNNKNKAVVPMNPSFVGPTLVDLCLVEPSLVARGLQLQPTERTIDDWDQTQLELIEEWYADQLLRQERRKRKRSMFNKQTRGKMNNLILGRKLEQALCGQAATDGDIRRSCETQETLVARTWS